MSDVTTVIIAKNEERNIARSIRSVRGLGPVIVADTGSVDRTCAIAELEGATVHRIEWQGFGRSKRKACESASTDYVLSIDADEVVSRQLARQIRHAISEAGAADGYFLLRVTNFCGSWILHSGWYPQYVLRLFRKDSGQCTDDLIHESIICKGRTARLDGLFFHYSYPSIDSFRTKIRPYARMGAARYLSKGGRLAAVRMMVNPPVSFVRQFILQLGFADGIMGLWIAVLFAAERFLKYWYALTEDRE